MHHVNVIQKKNVYLKKFEINERNFPSDGQKYFAQKIEQYNEENDLEQFLQPLIDTVVTT